MIDLNKNPKAVHALIQNDQVSVDGLTFVVDETDVVKGGIYLSLDTSNRRLYLSLSNEKKDELIYGDYCVHVRDSSNDHFAIFDRKDLEEHLTNHTYIIS